MLYLISPTLSMIPALLSATSHPVENGQTLQWFWSPLYNKVVFKHKWTYKLLTKLHDPSTQDACNTHDCDIPSFSSAVFLKHLVRFDVIDDQVSLYNLTFFQTFMS